MGIEADFNEVVSFDGTRVAWTDRGDGAVTVILANGIGCTDTYWVHLLPYLAEHGHRVVFWDYRAHGRSGPPSNPNEVAIGSHARDLWAVADAADARRAVLVGHSMGVQTILEAYRLAPERVAGLVALAGPFEHPAKTFYGASILHHVLPFVNAGMTAVPAVTRLVWQSMMEQADLMYWSGRAGRMIGGDAPKALMDEYFEHLSRLDPLVMIRMVNAMGDHSARDLLGHITTPTLVVAGENDVMTPPKVAAEMATSIPGARLEVLADTAHTLPIDHPDIVNPLVEEFVAAARPRRTRRRG